MKNWIKFGLLNALMGLLIGIYIVVSAIGDGYYFFPIIAPIAAFIVGGIFWKLLIKEDSKPSKIILTGILTGSVSHYFTFILLSILMNICYWTTGGCTGSMGDPPASILSMIDGSLVFTMFSLLFFGWITIPGSIGIGFLVKKLSK